ncbi:hypothetical protein HG530_009358 [Fusarium avenaceum]|nr:hypothetical protein HG530_009358 [Fusarium avenaceum]
MATRAIETEWPLTNRGPSRTSKLTNGAGIPAELPMETAEVTYSGRSWADKKGVADCTNKTKYHCEDSSVTRNSERLDLSVVPISKPTDDSREKSAVAVKNRVSSKLADAEQPDLPILETGVDIFLVHLVRRFGVADLSSHARIDKLAFCNGEIVRRVRVVCEPKPNSNSEDKCGNTLDDDNPSPAAKSCNAVHMTNAVSEQAAKRTCDGGTDKEIADSEGVLAFRVEHGEVDRESGEKSAFESTEDYTAGDQALEVLYNSGQGGDDAPGYSDERNPS